MPGGFENFGDFLGRLGIGLERGVGTYRALEVSREDRDRQRRQDLMARKLQEAQLSDYQRRAEDARRSDQEAQEQKAQLDIEAADVLHRYPELAEQYGTDFRPGGGARANIQAILQAGRERAAREEEQRQRELFPEQFVTGGERSAEIRAETAREREQQRWINDRVETLVELEGQDATRALQQAQLEYSRLRGGREVSDREIDEAGGRAFGRAEMVAISEMATQIANNPAAFEQLMAEAQDDFEQAMVRHARADAERIRQRGRQGREQEFEDLGLPRPESEFR
jgi:hypothetical protein